jgi:cell division transport system permease protein
LGAFFLTIVNLNRWAEELAYRVEIMVPLKDGLSAGDSRKVRLRIESLPGVRSVRFVSRREALQRMGLEAQTLGFDSSPLFDSFDVSVNEPQRVSTTASLIKEIRGVDADEVDYGENLAHEIFALRRVVWLIGGTAMIVLASAILLMVSNTIRLTIFARRRDIRLMQLVGATNEFICVPFVLEGVLHGIAGAMCACLILAFVYQSLVRWAPLIIPLAYSRSLMMQFCVLLFAAGIAFGVLGSSISLRRYFAKV